LVGEKGVNSYYIKNNQELLSVLATKDQKLGLIDTLKYNLTSRIAA